MKVTYQKKKDTYRLKMDGHCNSAPKGYDLVCAGASTLCLTLAQVLRNNEAMLRKPPKVELNDGDAELAWTPTEDDEATLNNVLYTILTGYEVLAYNYPECIELVKK